ncbi:hypothetical protein WI85_01800 [Burkholderia ubonensis]|uniref:DUF4148 domain-containing protein n=1 Tax=Burkholderia ubonensis TaxID=101571 RepID=UPI00075C0F05|nr:DUF4148 domain-containing protein [Burkholderia ubonensis]KVC91599.1 hypothetical protein WI77_14140 [Burkholderia ubonensis]KVD51731.1 hypothetical protein WI85_01800 [Burkholderia ubonensis]KWN71240.1 hypothetical protein WM23_31075 [Burkholderia ubonensis]
MKKTMIRAACIGILMMGAAAATQAQASSQPLTRAQVRQELAEYQAAGYRPAIVSSPDYPQNVQAITQRVAQARADAAGYGGNGHATVESGKRGAAPALDPSTYSHH